ncbi:hypothetical protein NHX12_033535, partial [Muraenolepis orangiensis]
PLCRQRELRNTRTPVAQQSPGRGEGADLQRLKEHYTGKGCSEGIEPGTFHNFTETTPEDTNDETVGGAARPSPPPPPCWEAGLVLLFMILCLFFMIPRK